MHDDLAQFINTHVRYLSLSDYEKLLRVLVPRISLTSNVAHTAKAIPAH